MEKTDQLLQKFLTEGMSSMRALKEQNDAIQKDMTDVKVAISTVREQIAGLNETFRKGQERLEKENDELRLKIVENERAVVALEKQIITLRSEGGRQAIMKLSNENVSLSARLSKLETQQNKWLGALAVIGVFVGFILSLIRNWFMG